jgi:hypothetical protein
MAERRPLFELHIRPMFRLLDQVHMLRLSPANRVDLFDYQQVRGRYSEILEWLDSASPMPPMTHGGPWPREWIDLFTRWKETGFGKLGGGASSNLQLVLIASQRYLLSCDVALSDATAMAWFDVVQARPEQQLYRIVVEQVDVANPTPTTASIEESIRGPLTVNEVVVIDAVGEHRLPIPTS